MTIDSQGRKISNFPALTTIPDGAVLTFVSGSTNYKITKADFLTALGVTGTLQAAGATTRTDVLQISGSVFTIRGFEDGNGVTFSISPSNGVKASVNLTQEGTYTPLIDTFATASPTFASLKAGAGISISKAANVITISATGDLPHAIVTMQGNSTATTIGSAGVAVLAAGTWVAGATENFATSAAGRLTYTGAETVRLSVDASVTFRRAVGAGETDVSVALARNGSINAASKRTTNCTDSARASVSLPYSIEMAQNDYIELYVTNEDSADDITVTDAIFRAAR